MCDELTQCSHSAHTLASCTFSRTRENLQRVPCSTPRMAYLGLEDAVFLPKVVHNPEDAQRPGEAQQVSQDAESAAEDQASPKGLAECLPNGPGTLYAL